MVIDPILFERHIMSRLLSKGFRKDPLSFQSGLTPKQTILIILAFTFIALVIGREIKIIQLKEEINELMGQLGQGGKYEIVK